MHSNLSYFSIINLVKSYNYQKHAKQSLSLLNIQSNLCANIALNDLDYTGIQPALLSSAEELYQNALTTRPWISSGEQNSGKFINRRSNDVITRQKIMNELYKIEYTLKKCSLLKIENNSSWVNFTHFREIIHLLALELIFVSLSWRVYMHINLTFKIKV